MLFLSVPYWQNIFQQGIDIFWKIRLDDSLKILDFGTKKMASCIQSEYKLQAQDTFSRNQASTLLLLNYKNMSLLYSPLIFFTFNYLMGILANNVFSNLKLENLRTWLMYPKAKFKCGFTPLYSCYCLNQYFVHWYLLYVYKQTSMI